MIYHYTLTSDSPASILVLSNFHFMLGIMMRSRVELMVKSWRCSCSPICLESGSAHPYAIYTSIYIRFGTYTTIYRECMHVCGYMHSIQCLGIQYTRRFNQHAHKYIFMRYIRRLIPYIYYMLFLHFETLKNNFSTFLSWVYFMHNNKIKKLSFAWGTFT